MENDAAEKNSQAKTYSQLYLITSLNKPEELQDLLQMFEMLTTTFHQQSAYLAFGKRLQQTLKKKKKLFLVAA